MKLSIATFCLLVVLLISFRFHLNASAPHTSTILQIHKAQGTPVSVESPQVKDLSRVIYPTGNIKETKRMNAGFEINGDLPVIGVRQEAATVPKRDEAGRAGIDGAIYPFLIVTVLDQAIQPDRGEYVSPGTCDPVDAQILLCHRLVLRQSSALSMFNRRVPHFGATAQPAPKCAWRVAHFGGCAASQCGTPGSSFHP